MSQDAIIKILKERLEQLRRGRLTLKLSRDGSGNWSIQRSTTADAEIDMITIQIAELEKKQ